MDLLYGGNNTSLHFLSLANGRDSLATQDGDSARSMHSLDRVAYGGRGYSTPNRL